MKILDIESFGWKKAIEGMRMSWASGSKIDSVFGVSSIIFGEKDKNLILKLCSNGSSHRKFLRTIHIQAKVIAPFYWWTEFDTYKVSTTRLSSSTMHTLGKKNVNQYDFDFDHCGEEERLIINCLNVKIDNYRKYKTTQTLREMKQSLPSSFLYTSIIDFSYESFLSMYFDRKDHRLKEWQQFLTAIEHNCPLMSEILDKV